MLRDIEMADYAVFDDMQGGIKFFHGWKNWLGCQPQFNIRVFHKDPPTITWGRPSIWLANEDPRNDLTFSETQWLEENCTFVFVDTPLFTPEPELAHRPVVHGMEDGDGWTPLIEPQVGELATPDSPLTLRSWSPSPSL